jgi:hypothetical protein
MKRSTSIIASLAALAVVVGLLATRSGLAASMTVSSKNLTSIRTCALVTMSSVGGIDAGVRQATPTTNYGALANANVSGSLSDNRRMYLRFDLGACVPAIPATSTVTNALLRINSSAQPSVCRTNDIFRVSSSWTETGITWNTQPFGTSLNNPSSGQRTAALQIGNTCATNNLNGYVTGWNVTPDVNAWVRGTAQNHGWMIRDDAEGVLAAAATYRTREANGVTLDPWLVITYVP